MGAHHFKIYLVPPGILPARNKEGDHEGGFLETFSLSEPIVQRFRQIFTNPNHWGAVEEYCSTSPWGSDLRIWHSEDGRIEEVTFRFAPVADPIQKLDEFLQIAKDAGFHLLLWSSGTIVAPELEDVIKALKAHHSFKFISDPKAAIIEASQKIHDQDFKSQ